MATLLPPPEDFLRRLRFLAMGLPEGLFRDWWSLRSDMEYSITLKKEPSTDVDRQGIQVLK